MKKLIRLAAVGGLIMTVSASPAHAACSGTYGGSSFGTCADAVISSFFDANAGLTVVTVQFSNLGTFGEIFTAFGLHSLPAGTTLFGTGNFQKSASLSTWSLVTNGGGFGNLPDVDFVGNTNGVNGGLGNGGSGWFSFELAGDRSGVSFQDNWGIHAQSGPAGCSTKLIVTGGAANSPTGFADDGTACASSSVPEPATMILLGTGLVGVFGGAAARRKRAI